MAQGYQTGSVMPEEVFGRPLIEPWYAFPDGCCPYTVFSLVNENDSHP
jgi:hypothetical protein